MNVSPILARLDPLIRRLASSSDGEVVACVRAIERQLDKVGASWHDLADRLTADPGATAECNAPPVFDYTETVDWLLATYRGQLSAREINFCENMRNTLPRREPTPKQAQWIDDLVVRMGERQDG